MLCKDVFHRKFTFLLGWPSWPTWPMRRKHLLSSKEVSTKPKMGIRGSFARVGQLAWPVAHPVFENIFLTFFWKNNFVH